MPASLAALTVLPVLLVALLGTRKQVWFVVCGAALVESALVLAGEDTSFAAWEDALAWMLVASLAGPLVHRLAADRRRESRRAGALQPVGWQLDSLLRGATSQSVIATDLDGLITVFNTGAERLLGYSAEEMVGRRTPACLHDPDEVHERAAELGLDPGFEVFVHEARNGRGCTSDWIHITKDGTRLVVSLSITGVVDDHGELVGFMGIGTDVTAERRSASALASEREINRTLIDHLPGHSIGLLDAQLRWITVGGDLPRWLNCTADDLRGELIGSTLSRRDRVRLRAIVSGARVAGAHAVLDTDSGVWFDVDARPVCGASGEDLILVVVRDITSDVARDRERDELVSSLATQQESLRAAFDGTPIGVAWTSLEPGRRGELIQVNPAFAELVGRPGSDLLGGRIRALVHPDDAWMLADPATDDPRTRQMRWRAGDGTTGWVELTSVVVRDQQGGAPAYVMHHVQDVTARRDAERSLVHSLERQRAATEALREVDSMRADFISSISHDLKTPLTNVVAYLELFGSDNPELSKDHARMIEVAVRNARRLNDLIDDLGTATTLDRSAVAADLTETLDVDTFVGASTETVAATIERRAQTLIIDHTAVDERVVGDGGALQRAITNLLGNASKYAGDDATITLRTRRVRDVIEFSVVDDGPGIAAEELPRLFERGYRAASARTGRVRGSGLGLAIVREIAEQHGGDLRVDSIVGEGATFTLSVPAALTDVSVAS